MLLSIGDLTVEDAVKPKLTPGTIQIQNIYFWANAIQKYIYLGWLITLAHKRYKIS